VPPEPAEQVCVAVAVDNYGLDLPHALRICGKRGKFEKFGFEDVEHDFILRLLEVSCV
jgi:hypothetical protein